MSRLLLQIARYAWAGPCTVAGLIPAMVILLLGGSMRIKSGVLEVALSETIHKAWPSFIAITLGHVVLGQSAQALDQLSAHELEHVRQYERWGVLFFLAYPLSSLIQWLRGKDPYWSNYFEVQARQRCANTDREPDNR